MSRKTISGKARIALPHYFLTGPALIAGLALPLAAAPRQGATPPPGERIFRQRCASCHGDKGQGGKGYAAKLTGPMSVKELAAFIAKSMPPGPKPCAGPDAQNVAAYIYDAFYSPTAQERNRPAAVAVSRLTVRQFRNAVADLVRDYHPAIPADARRGLHAEYYKNRDFDDKARVIDRIDPQVQFDFGTNGPVPEQFDPHHFSIAWSGSVLAPDTGEYEFVVKTEHAVRLFVNDENQPLIDAWVKSGNDNEYHGTIHLLGGRAYPIRLEFSKSTIGVDDSEQKKGKPAPKASIALLWKRPRMAVETIPQRCLCPASSPPTFVVTTPFPPDDRSTGYERANSISKAWDEAVTNAALETARYIASHLRAVTDVPNDAPDRIPRLKAYCREFVQRAFRRPLTPEIIRLYVDKPFEVTTDAESAVKRSVLLTLVSPHFLYREIDGQPDDPYNVASRLSFGLWDSLPDPELLKAAGSGALSTREQIIRQADRLSADPRAWNNMREFLLSYLKVEPTPDITKSKDRYPDFDSSVASDLRTSLELSLENAFCSERSDYRDLMLSHTLYLNGRLAKVYGANLPDDAPFQPVTLAASDRSGVLTHPYLLSRFAYLDSSSPIHRGVLIIRNLLGRVLQPPPAAFTPIPASLHPEMTTRQRVSMQTKPSPCNSCHNQINPLGFTLERYDAIGRLRQVENGQPIDASGSYRDRQGRLVSFGGAQDLSRYLAESDEAQGAFAEKLFQYLVKQPVQAYGPETLPELKREFARNQYNMRKLMVEIMALTALPNQSSQHTPTRVAQKS